MNYTVAIITPTRTRPVATFLTRKSAESYARKLWRSTLLPGGIRNATDVQVSSGFDGSKWSGRARSFLANATPTPVTVCDGWLDS